MADRLKPRLSLLTLGVEDMSHMRAFYEALGLEASQASTESITFFDLGGVVLGLFGYDELAKDADIQSAPRAPYRGFSLAWNTDSPAAVDRIMGQVKKMGARIAKPSQKTFWGGYSGYFLDPEDNLWEVAHNPFFPFDERGALRLP